MKLSVSRIVAVVCFGVLANLTVAQAHGGEEHGSGSTTIASTSEKVTKTKLGFRPTLQSQIPLDTTFRDEKGSKVTLRHYFLKRPVILVLLYYSCSTMCIAELETLESSLRDIEFNAGREFDVVAVSIDPRESAAEARKAKDHYVPRYGRPGAAQGWHFLTGDEASIKRLTTAIGFGYAQNKTTGEYEHPNGILVLTPEGKISKFFADFDYPPFDLRLSLIAASPNRTAKPADKVLLLAMKSDDGSGRYSLNLLNVGGVALLLAGLALVPYGLRTKRAAGKKIRVADSPTPTEPASRGEGAQE